MRAFSRILKTASAITLFFFCWTYMPLFQVAAWAAESKHGLRVAGSGSEKQKPVPVQSRTGVSPVSRQSDVAAGFSLRNEKNKRPEERFEKAIEEIREKVGRAEEKTAKNEDTTVEIEAIKKQRTEIGEIDIELRKEFAETKKKLRDAKLPQEILDRHYKFVKHYEDNLAELKANLAGIEQSAESKRFKEALKKAKDHLEKTRPPKKHVSLDPNKLPHRTVKAKPRAPRLKKEEFERDFPPQKTLCVNIAETPPLW